MSLPTDRTPDPEQLKAELDAHLELSPWSEIEEERTRKALAQALVELCDRAGEDELEPDARVEVPARLLALARDLAVDALADHRALNMLRRGRDAAQTPTRDGALQKTRAALGVAVSHGRPRRDAAGALADFRLLTTPGARDVRWVINRRSGERVEVPLSPSAAIKIVADWHGYPSADACIHALEVARPKKGEPGFVSLPARRRD